MEQFDGYEVDVVYRFPEDKAHGQPGMPPLVMLDGSYPTYAGAVEVAGCWSNRYEIVIKPYDRSTSGRQYGPTILLRGRLV